MSGSAPILKPADLGLCLCHACKLASRDQPRCEHCGSALHYRKPQSLQRTWAFWLAAVVFFFPANLLPIMSASSFQGGGPSTVLSGVVQLWEGGAYDIAIVIFIASVAVPVTKLLVLFLMLLVVQGHAVKSPASWTRLYRLLEFIGYWSMLDVFVVALLAALVQFGVLGEVKPMAGTLYFGLVVVLTMLATLSFDVRLLWDRKRVNE